MPESQQFREIVLIATVSTGDEVSPGASRMMNRRRVDASRQCSLTSEACWHGYTSAFNVCVVTDVQRTVVLSDP